jgi:hypothetical protein
MIRCEAVLLLQAWSTAIIQTKNSVMAIPAKILRKINPPVTNTKVFSLCGKGRGSAVIAITAARRTAGAPEGERERKRKSYVDEFCRSGRYPSQVSTGSRGYLGNFGFVAES